MTNILIDLRGLITIAILLGLVVSVFAADDSGPTSLMIPLGCQPKLEAMMTNLTEVNKWEFSAANTILTFLPALVTFAPLPTAHLPSMMVLNPPAALFTAGMMFALPIRFTWPLHRVLKIRYPDGRITSYGIFHRLEGLRHGQIQEFYELHRWYAPGAENRALLELQRRVLHRRGSSTIGGIILWTFLFVILQWVMCCILMQLRHLFQGFIMLDCAGISAYILPFWPIWLLAVSAVVRGIPAMINRRMKEVIYLTPLPAGFALTNALAVLWVISFPIGDCQNGRVASATENSSIGFTASSRWPFKRRTYQLFLFLLRSRPPTIVVVRLATPVEEGDPNPIKHSIRGFGEAIMILYLTFSFATFYGSYIFNTVIFIAALITTIALSRISSIAALMFLQEVFQFTVVECGDTAEKRGIIRLLAAIPGVLVSKQGQQKRYTGGWRVDNHGKHLRMERGVLLLLKLIITTVFFVVVGVIALFVSEAAGLGSVILVFGLTKWGMWRYLGDVLNSFWVEVQEEPRARGSEVELELGDVVAEQHRV